MGKIRFFILLQILFFSFSLNIAQARDTGVNQSLKDECAQVFKEVEDMFEYENTLEILSEKSWGKNLDRAMIFLDWCVKYGLIEIK